MAAYSAGPRVIQTQLCLTLSALAIQLTDAEWPDVVTGMTARFGNDPSSVGVLLEFLTVLPEEITTNHRIPVDVSYTNQEPSLQATVGARRFECVCCIGEG